MTSQRLSCHLMLRHYRDAPRRNAYIMQLKKAKVALPTFHYRGKNILIPVNSYHLLT